MTNSADIFLISEEFTDQAFALLQECKTHLSAQGIEQWDDIYPSYNHIMTDIQNREMYGIQHQGTLIAFIVINTFQSPLYQSINWRFTAPPILVIHRLCVAPVHQNKGIAKKLIQYAEKQAIDNHYTSIRLDAFGLHPAALHLYDSLQYTRVGTMEARKGLFICFEKQTDTIIKS